ncbi:hypothetical protein MRB53_039449 [Persea americana]|nr:hypothetical protein MRB53_039449 [Persea americana]
MPCHQRSQGAADSRCLINARPYTSRTQAMEVDWIVDMVALTDDEFDRRGSSAASAHESGSRLGTARVLSAPADLPYFASFTAFAYGNDLHPNGLGYIDEHCSRVECATMPGAFALLRGGRAYFALQLGQLVLSIVVLSISVFLMAETNLVDSSSTGAAVIVAFIIALFSLVYIACVWLSAYRAIRAGSQGPFTVALLSRRHIWRRVFAEMTIAFGWVAIAGWTGFGVHVLEYEGIFGSYLIGTPLLSDDNMKTFHWTRYETAVWDFLLALTVLDAISAALQLSGFLIYIVISTKAASTTAKTVVDDDAAHLVELGTFPTAVPNDAASLPPSYSPSDDSATAQRPDTATGSHGRQEYNLKAALSGVYGMQSVDDLDRPDVSTYDAGAGPSPCRTLASAQKLGKGITNTSAISLDVNDEKALDEAVRDVDVVVSLIPYTFHAQGTLFGDSSGRLR